MRAVVAVMAGLGGAALAMLLVAVAPTAMRRRRGAAVEAVVVGAAAGALLVRSAPTGSFVADIVLPAGVAALSTWAAARADHRMVAAVAMAVSLMLGLSPWATAGAGVAVAVVALRQRVPPLKGLAGGLLAVGLMAEIGPQGGSWPEAVAFVLLVAMAGAAARRTSSRARRAYALGIAAVLGYLVVAAAGFLTAAVPAFQDLDRAVHLSEGAASALSTGASTSPTSLGLAASAFRSAEDRLGSAPARLVAVIPGVAQNAEALRALAAAGGQVAEAASGAAGAGDLRLQEGAIDLAVVARVGHEVHRTSLTVTEAWDGLADARSPSLVPPVREALDELGSRLAEARPTLGDLDAALERLPALLGGNGPRRYLLALQTPAELRAAGGIIGSFAVLEADGGRLSLSRAGSVDELNRAGDPAARSVSGADEYLSRYGQYQPLQAWQNLTLSPDWPTVGAVTAQLFPQSGGAPVHGVFGVDPFALAKILEVTGPVDVPPWPVPITSETAVPILLHEQYLRFPNPERREFLAEVTAAVFERLTQGGIPLQALAPALAGATAEDHLQVWLAEEGEQRLAERFDLDGALLADSPGDSLAVVNQNSSGNKIDWFLRRSTEYAVRFDPVVGRAEATLRVALSNEAPAKGLPPYVIGSAGPPGSQTAPGENRSLVSVFTRLDLQSATLDGVPVQMSGAEELGHQVHSLFITIAPGSTVVLELRLSGPVDPVDGGYRLDVDHQVLARPEAFSATVEFTEGWQPDGTDAVRRDLVHDETIRFAYRRSS